MGCFVFRDFATNASFRKANMIEGREMSFYVSEKNIDILEVTLSWMTSFLSNNFDR